MSAATTAALRDHAPREVSAAVSEVPAPAPVKPGFGQRRSTRVFAGLTALAVVGALGAWALGHGKESTDDAQVEGRVASVSPRVAGQVAKVLVMDNQSVKRATCSWSWTPRTWTRSWRSARGRPRGARGRPGLRPGATSSSPRRTRSATSARRAAASPRQLQRHRLPQGALDQARADVEAAEAARPAGPGGPGPRAQELAKAEAISRADIDARRSRAEQAHAQLEQARARLATTEANLASSGGGGRPRRAGSPPPRRRRRRCRPPRSRSRPPRRG